MRLWIPGYPEERLRYMAGDAEVRLVLGQQGVVERLGRVEERERLEKLEGGVREGEWQGG